MNLKLQAARNIGSNWFGLGVALLIGFLLSPYILHRLGDTAFGFWILIFSSTGYYGLFDLGVRASVVKHVAKYSATGERDKIDRLISTSVFGFSCIAVLLLGITGFLAANIDYLFHVSPEYRTQAQRLFLIVGGSVALGFPLSVFTGVLQGLQEYHWINFTLVGGTVLRALAIIVALNFGGGLLTVGLITAGFPLIISFVNLLLAQHKLSSHLSWRYIDGAAYRELVGYGSITFVTIVADRLRFQTDVLVIGAVLGATWITYYSIGSKLVDYAIQVVDSMADVFMPMSSSLDARGESERLRRLFLDGNRACALVIFPICIGLLILGKQLITVWVGAKYLSSYTILVLLLVPRTLYRAQGASNRILLGMARHKTFAAVVIVEAFINLALSIILAKRMGIVGIALGTLIPLMLTTVFFLPPYLCRLLQVPLLTFLKTSYLAPAGLCVPMAATLFFLRHLFPARNYPELIIQVVVGAAVYMAGLTWLFFKYESLGIQLRGRMSGRLQSGFGRKTYAGLPRD
jgi:O-antigen/teichoic acid export membrane protein